TASRVPPYGKPSTPPHRYPSMIRIARCLLALLLSAVATAPAACEFIPPHPIDQAYAAAVERSGGVTSQLRDAQGEAWQAWDAEMERVQAVLRVTAPRDELNLLRAAQRAWLAFDAAQTRWDAALLAGSGSAAAIEVADAALARRRARVCQLTNDMYAL